MAQIKNVLILNWKDIKHPEAGGSELVIHELAKRLVKDGIKTDFLTSKFPGTNKFEEIDGIGFIRLGNKYTHNFLALIYRILKLRNKYDLIIECVNTAPYFSNFFKGNSKVVLFYHQLAREIWFYETMFPINILGYMFEAFYTYIQALFQNKVITISQSTKSDLLRFGFKDDNIFIIPQATNIKPLQKLSDSITKEEKFTILYLGSFRKMKRVDEILRAFHRMIAIEHRISRKGNIKLWIVGRGPIKEVNKLQSFVAKKGLQDKVYFWLGVDDQKRNELIQRSHLLTNTSLKEGWGLVVTEAAQLGVPSVVYSVDGLRDSVVDCKTGIILNHNTSSDLITAWEDLFDDRKKLEGLRKEAWKLNKSLNFDNSYLKFKGILGI